MRAFLAVGGLLVGLCVARPGAAERSAEARLLPPARPVPLIVVLRRPGLRTYERVAEEFRGRVPAEVRVLAVRPRRSGRAERSREELRRWLRATRPNLVFAIGQAAYDFASTAAPELPLLHALVFRHADSRSHGIASAPPAQAVLVAFSRARPGLRAVGVLCGPSSQKLLAPARAAADALGISLVPLRAGDPADAIQKLHRAQRALDGVWLLPDLDVLSAQVFQFAVALQYRRRIPLMGATATHVAQGALFAVDTPPATIGLRAAEVAKAWLAAGAPGRPHGAPPLRGPAGEHEPQLASSALRLSLNRITAQRIGVGLRAFDALGPEVLP